MAKYCRCTIVLMLGLMLASLSAGYAATLTVRGFDSTAIKAALDKSQAGDTVFLPAGTYKLSAAIAPKSGTILQGAGQTQTILTYVGEKSSALISLTQVAGVTVTDLSLEGNNNPHVTCGVYAYDAKSLTIRNLTIRDLIAPGAHGIHFNGNNPTHQHGCTDSLVEDCTIANISPDDKFGCGIRFSWGSSHNQVLNCHIDNTGRGGIFADNDSGNLVIRGNIVTHSHGTRLGIEVWGGCDHCVIEDNKIDHWLSIGGCDWCAVRRNTISCTDGDFGFIGIEAIGSYLVFTDNVVDDGQVVGLSVSNKSVKQYQYYANDTFRRCSEWGAQLQGDPPGCRRYYFYRCRFTGTTVGRGKVPYAQDDGNGFRINGNTRDLVLEDCDMSNNGRDGIQCVNKGIDALDFVGCSITDNKGPAVVMAPGYTALQWQNCTVKGNRNNTLPPARTFASAPPAPGFQIVGEARVGQRLRFHSTAKAAAGLRIDKVLWDLGAGTPQAGDEVRGTYQKPGTYTVTQIVWDSAGRAARATRQVVVKP